MSNKRLAVSRSAVALLKVNPDAIHILDKSYLTLYGNDIRRLA
jgi:hypothetical protein